MWAGKAPPGSFPTPAGLSAGVEHNEPHGDVSAVHPRGAPRTPLTNELPRVLRNPVASDLPAFFVPRLAPALGEGTSLTQDLADDGPRTSEQPLPFVDTTTALYQAACNYRRQYPGQTFRRENLQQMLPPGIVVDAKISQQVYTLMRNMDRDGAKQKRKHAMCDREELRQAVFKSCLRVSESASVLPQARRSELMHCWNGSVDRCLETIDAFVKEHGESGQEGVSDYHGIASILANLDEAMIGQEQKW